MYSIKFQHQTTRVKYFTFWQGKRLLFRDVPERHAVELLTDANFGRVMREKALRKRHNAQQRPSGKQPKLLSKRRVMKLIKEHIQKGK